MGLFGGKKSGTSTGAAAGISGFTKPRKFLFFKIRAKPVYVEKPKSADAGIAGFTKPRRFLPFKINSRPSFLEKPKMVELGIAGAAKPKFPFFKMKARPVFVEKPKSADAGIAGVAKPMRFPSFKINARPAFLEKPKKAEAAKAAPVTGTVVGAPAVPSHPGAANYRRPDKLQMYFMSVAAKQKNLDDALKARGIKEAPYEFVRKMFSYALIVSVVMVVAFAVLLWHFGLGATGVILAVLLGVAIFQALFNKFVRYPLDRSKVEGTNIERDILFAARDLVISMRSGMPLFNAMATVSSGYGAASKEFGKVVELIQLGTPAEQAIDDVSGKSQSKTFKRIMLQASVSIRVGADVAGALQGVVDEVTQERIIELRRYGQRLNVLSMFYMLFGVIFPSMGVAVAVILTTFVNIFTVTNTTLIFVIVGIFFLQIIFLEVMRSSRPVFAM